MRHTKWDDFTNMVEWSAYTYAEYVAFDGDVAEMKHPSSFHRMCGDWEVAVFFSGNDGCWKWSADKRENIGKNEYPHMVYDEIGMTFLDCMEECFNELVKEGII
ncbi:MAG: hypothetical protein IJ087_01305 [Eggerthellaceae bacterium]|nr:hypothetical protein [Eggerthellaceae bacterium]